MRQSTRLIINSVVTYSRMLVTVGIGLLVTRLLIKTLGISDFGLLMALGASGTLLSMFRDALTASGERHMAHEIGRGDPEALKRVFASSLLVHMVVAAGALVIGAALMPVIITLAEVPEGRHAAAWWVLGATIVGVVFAILVAPFAAIISAHQEIPIRTAFELAGRLLTLGVVLVLQVVPTDRLASYAVMSVAAVLLLESIFAGVCILRYPACRAGLRGATRQSAWELVSFGGWNVVGSMIVRLRMQGTIFLLNILFGTVVNAAYAIAVQAASYQNQLTWAMMGAIKPAMTTMHGRDGQSQSVIQLVRMANKFPVYLGLLLLIPVVWETEAILTIWLGDYPDWTPYFVRLTMITMLIGTISNGYSVLMSSRGELRGITLLGVIFQVGGMLSGWLGIVLLDWGPTALVWSAFVSTLLFSVARVVYVDSVTGLHFKDYLLHSALPIACVVLFAMAASSGIYFSMPEGLLRLCLIATIPAACTIVSAWFLGMTDFERHHFRRVAGLSLSFVTQKLLRK